MEKLHTTPLVSLHCHYFARGSFLKFRQNLSVTGTLRISVGKFRMAGRPARIKKGLSGEVFWPSFLHTLSDLYQIWYTYGYYGPPS